MERQKGGPFTRAQIKDLFEKNARAFHKMVDLELALREQRDIILTFPIVFNTTRGALRQLSQEVRDLDRHVGELIWTVQRLGGTGAKDAAGPKQRGNRRQKRPGG